MDREFQFGMTEEVLDMDGGGDDGRTQYEYLMPLNYTFKNG